METSSVTEKIQELTEKAILQARQDLQTAWSGFGSPADQEPNASKTVDQLRGVIKAELRVACLGKSNPDEIVLLTLAGNLKMPDEVTAALSWAESSSQDYSKQAGSDNILVAGEAKRRQVALQTAIPLIHNLSVQGRL